MANVKKNKTGQIGSRLYGYTDLAAINTFLEEHGLTYEQYIETEQVGDNVVDRIMTQRYKILENGSLEKWDEPKRGLRLDYPPNETPQQLGSRVTYLRRYSLSMAFGLAAEDDDGASAGQRKPQNNQRPPQKQPAKPQPKIDQAFLCKVKGKLATINTDEQLDAYWKELGLNKQYQGYLLPSFKKRRGEIANGVGR